MGSKITQKLQTLKDLKAWFFGSNIQTDIPPVTFLFIYMSPLNIPDIVKFCNIKLTKQNKSFKEITKIE